MTARKICSRASFFPLEISAETHTHMFIGSHTQHAHMSSYKHNTFICTNNRSCIPTHTCIHLLRHASHSQTHTYTLHTLTPSHTRAHIRYTHNLSNTLSHTFIHSLMLTCSPNTGTTHCSVYTKLSPPHRWTRYRAGLN